MKFSHFFIERPIFAAVLSILITLAGAITAFLLPIAQFPDVVPPTVVVTAVYPGADAETIAETVDSSASVNILPGCSVHDRMAWRIARYVDSPSSMLSPDAALFPAMT